MITSGKLQTDQKAKSQFCKTMYRVISRPDVPRDTANRPRHFMPPNTPRSTDFPPRLIFLLIILLLRIVVLVVRMQQPNVSLEFISQSCLRRRSNRQRNPKARLDMNSTRSVESGIPREVENLGIARSGERRRGCFRETMRNDAGDGKVDLSILDDILAFLEESLEGFANIGRSGDDGVFIENAD